MMIYLSLLICLAGAFVYSLSTNPKLVEIGRMSYWVGLLAFLMTVHASPVGHMR